MSSPTKLKELVLDARNESRMFSCMCACGVRAPGFCTVPASVAPVVGVSSGWVVPKLPNVKVNSELVLSLIVLVLFSVERAPLSSAGGVGGVGGVGDGVSAESVFGVSVEAVSSAAV